MELWEAIVLGIIQGLTEFLPVSSSGHLEIANALFGIRESNNLAFTVAVHGATVLSTIVVFWHEIGQLLKGLFLFQMNEQTRFILNIGISMIPVLIVGLFFKDSVEALFTSNMTLVGCTLLVTAALLTFSQYAPRRNRMMSPWSALMMGIAQAIAVLPGLSRSGSTISTGLIMGVKPEEVTKFSFLMVLIPILGMNFLNIVSGSFAEGDSVGSLNLIAGAVAAFVTGTLACKWMVGIVKRGKLIWFALYCLCVGAGVLIYSLIH